MRGDILHVAHIFVTPFNLEGAYTSINQRAEVGSLIVIFHRQQMFFIGNHPPLIVFQCVWQTARLRAIATVGATPCLRMRNVALTRIGHAQCPMNKEFNGRVRSLVNRADLIKIQLSRQHNLREANIREELRFFNCTNVALRTGVQFNRRNIKFQNPHILNNQRIDTGLVEVSNQPLRGFQLIIMQNGVKRDENFCTITMGKRHQLGNIFQAITGIMTGTKTRAADINSIGTVQNSFAGNGGIACRA